MVAKQWWMQLRWALVEQGTSAPVTSMDRHTSTKLKLCCGEDAKNEKALVGQSTSAPVTSMDRHTSTKMQLRWRCQKLNLGLTKYKCTCHVYGQTHKYEMQLWWRCQKLNLGWTKYKCTCHVYGQTHKYRKINSNTVKGEVCAQTEKLDLVVQKKRYECTCHVYGQTHKYKTN